MKNAEITDTKKRTSAGTEKESNGLSQWVGGGIMLKKMFQKIRKWWRDRMELIEEVERYKEEMKSGTLMRGGSFSEMAKKKEE